MRGLRMAIVNIARMDSGDAVYDIQDISRWHI